MNPLAYPRLAWRAVRTNGLRSALTMLGIVIGVAAVIAMVAIGSGAQERVQNQIASLGANLIIILPGSVTQGGARIGTGARASLSQLDAEAIRAEVEGVVAVAPTVRQTAQVVAANLNWQTWVTGTTPDFFEARDWDVEEGRRFTEEDMEGAPKIALVGRTVANNLFADQDPVGREITVRRVPLTIIGVLASKGQSTGGQDQDDVVIIPITTAKLRVLGSNRANRFAVGSILVETASAEALGPAAEQISQLLRQRHRLRDDEDDDFSLRVLSDVFQAMESATRVMTLLLAAVAGVSLVVGGIGIMNIMLVSVTERTREIGLRRAVGARQRDILAQFLTEAVTLCLLGGLIGVAVGVGASLAIAEIAGWRVLLGPMPIAIAVGFAAAIGVFFGWYPARKAASLDPIEALRYE
jgi:putative ABC transport system permease protein